MVLWFYLQALLGNGAHLFSAVHRNQRDVEEQMIFFKLSLSGFKVWAQSDSAQIDQPWSKTVHGQECCKFFSFVRIKVFHGKGLGFWRFFFFLLELSNEFFWFWFWLNNLLHWNFAAFSIAALAVPQDKSSGPCYLPMPLFPIHRPHEQPMIPTPAPFLEGACWRRSRCSSLDQNSASLLESCWTQPCPGGGSSGKEQHPRKPSKTLLCQKYCTCLCRSELGWRKTLDFGWNQMGGLKHIHRRTTTKRTKPTRGANLTLSTSSSRYMSLEKQPISNSWF